MTEQSDDDGFYKEGDGDDVESFTLDLTSPRDGSANGAVGLGSSNGESSNGKSANGEPSNGKSANGESSNGESANGESSNGESANGEHEGESEDEAEVEPVELLVQLAENGEIDPWDIDIVSVTDAFLACLDEGDLRTSGRALFYASVLLRMKSDELLAPDEPEADEEPWEAEMAGGSEFDFDPIDALEAEMDRRLDRKHARGSPETLDELVHELREAERGSWWKSRRTYDTTQSPHGYARGTQTLDYRSADDFRDGGEPTEEDVTGTAHAEHIETTIGEVETVLRTHYENGREEVLFAEIRAAGGSPVDTFLALLFLAHRGIVSLQQDELFGDLWVQNATSVAVSDEAIAD